MMALSRDHGIDRSRLGLAVALLACDLLACRGVVAMFDRERLVTGSHG